MQEFGSISRLFHCEAQFQFELAWEIHKLFEENSGINVYLECVKNIKEKENNKSKKYYTDIVIEDSNNNFLAIELKYKTKKGTNGYSILKTHSAQNLGRYDFLLDVLRNEQLMINANKDYGNCIGGFCIFLTNDATYWNNSGENCLYKDFSLKNERKIPSEQNLEWNITKEKSNDKLCRSIGKERLNRKIKLSGNYSCEWLSYNDIDENSEFKFLIFEFKN